MCFSNYDTTACGDNVKHRPYKILYNEATKWRLIKRFTVPKSF